MAIATPDPLDDAYHLAPWLEHNPLCDSNQYVSDIIDEERIQHFHLLEPQEEPKAKSWSIALPSFINFSPQSSTRTEYLDGLRGLAALFVFFHHITPNFTVGTHEPGFGQDGSNWHLTNMPFLRLIWSGGNAAVPIFFLLSGYALSIGPLQKLKNGKGGEVRRGLLEAAVRRPIRLYAPALAITIIQAVLLQIPGLVVIDPDIPPFPKGDVLEELEFMISNLGYFSPFLEHETGVARFHYNHVMWTLPIELKWSFLIYGALFTLSMGIINGPGAKKPAALSLILFIGGATMLQTTCNWSLTCFTWGLALAVIDTWPIGEIFQSKMQGVYGRRQVVYKAAGLLFSPTSPRLRLSRSYFPETPTIIAHICLFMGWYLLSEPGFPAHRWYSTNTPGWKWLSRLIPPVYDNAVFFRYWMTWGSLLVVYSILRIRWLQTFFQSRLLKFLGRISFALYLIHAPWTHIFADRLKSLVGGYTAPQLEGGFWDKRFVISNMGPPGLSPRFLICMAAIVPSTLLVAWLGTIAIDEPSVRLGKWFSRTLGIERVEKAGTDRQER